VTKHRHFRLVEIGKDVDAALEKYSALSRQRDAPCRSLQQAYAKPILEPHDAFAHRRPRQTDTFRGRSKALCLGDVNKGVNIPHSFDCHWLAPSQRFRQNDDSGVIGARNSPVMGKLGYF
jgi:hypothetical protein